MAKKFFMNDRDGEYSDSTDEAVEKVSVVNEKECIVTGDFIAMFTNISRKDSLKKVWRHGDRYQFGKGALYKFVCEDNRV